ncbi:MAG: tRNA dihydrouridine synthase DusB [Nevskiales bacterium]
MRLGPYTLANNLVLAPMAGVTDRPFRLLCRGLGAGLAVSEMVSANPALWGTDKSLRRSDHAGEPEPRVVQIAGGDPAMMAAAARYNVARGAQIIDINMGCPAKKVCHQAAGSALLSDETLVARILEATVKAVTIPVTLKIRTGPTRESRNGLRLARIAQDCGIVALSVHGRTRADKFAGAAEYETIAAIKQAVRIPVIANGDIATPEQAAAVLRATGADGLMLGRAAQGNPWIFREVAHYLARGSRLAPPGIEEVRAVFSEHIRALHLFYGEEQGLRVARKHMAWYLQAQGLGAGHYRQLMQAESAAVQLELIERCCADFRLAA